jgi:methyl-accepting chemotaxis protein
MSEFVRVRKDEWEALRKDVETFIQHYEASSRKVKDMMKENTSLKEQLRAATERLNMADQKAAAELQQTTAVLQRMRANMSHIVQETEKEMKA